MRDDTLSLDSILGEFHTAEAKPDPGANDRQCVTFWLTPEDKARYDRLQARTKGQKRKFSKVAKETLLALIALAEKRSA